MFVIKRKFGDTVFSRSYGLLRKETLLNAVCYNACRETMLFIGGFLQGSSVYSISGICDVRL